MPDETGTDREPALQRIVEGRISSEDNSNSAISAGSLSIEPTAVRPSYT